MIHAFPCDFLLTCCVCTAYQLRNPEPFFFGQRVRKLAIKCFHLVFGGRRRGQILWLLHFLTPFGPPGSWLMLHQLFWLGHYLLVTPSLRRYCCCCCCCHLLSLMTTTAAVMHARTRARLRGEHTQALPRWKTIPTPSPHRHTRGRVHNRPVSG